MRESICKQLEACGFKLAESASLFIAVFPDGDAAHIVPLDQLNNIDADAVCALAVLRSRALNALFTLFADAGWGTHRYGGGLYSFGADSVSMELHFGYPLSFWLQRESLLKVVQRFARGISASKPTAKAIASAELLDSRARSLELYQRHLARVAEIENSAVDIEFDPELKSEMLLSVEAFRSTADAEHAQKVRKLIVSVDVDTQLRAELASFRAELKQGVSMWLGASPLWASEQDLWVRPEEWLKWAEALDGLDLQGAAFVLMHLAPDKYRSKLRSKVRAAQRQGQFEYDKSDAELAVHLLDDPKIADWVISPKPYQLADALAHAGYLDALFEAWFQLQQSFHLAGDLRADEPHPIHDVGDLCRELGTRVRSFLSDEQREVLLSRAMQLLGNRVKDAAPVIAQSLSKIAWALGSKPLAEALLADNYWREALLYRMGEHYLCLKEAVLALSLIAPNRDCALLIQQACVHIEGAYEQYAFDTTARALAVAWERCRAAYAP